MATGRTKRYFGVSEANAQVPRLNDLFGTVMQLRGQLKSMYGRLDDAGFPPKNDRTMDADMPSELRRDHSLFHGMADTLRDHLEQIIATGCVIKDLDVGLVDWPALYRGREVWLCWKYGEKEVRFWHDLETGFDGRRPVSELAETAQLEE